MYKYDIDNCYVIAEKAGNGGLVMVRKYTGEIFDVKILSNSLNKKQIFSV